MTKVVQDYQSYSETAKGKDDDILKDELLIPLEEGVLFTNIGLPVIVVCSKSDTTMMLENSHDFRNEHFDFIQMHLRKACLEYGAALIYRYY